MSKLLDDKNDDQFSELTGWWNFCDDVRTTFCVKRSRNFLQIFFSHIFETFRSGSYKGHFAKVLETIDNSLRQNIVMKNFWKGKKNWRWTWLPNSLDELGNSSCQKKLKKINTSCHHQFFFLFLNFTFAYHFELHLGLPTKGTMLIPKFNVILGNPIQRSLLDTLSLILLFFLQEYSETGKFRGCRGFRVRRRPVVGQTWLPSLRFARNFAYQFAIFG